MMRWKKFLKYVNLITLGKEKGYLNYDEINALSPADVIAPEQLDDIFVFAR